MYKLCFSLFAQFMKLKGSVEKYIDLWSVVYLHSLWGK